MCDGRGRKVDEPLEPQARPRKSGLMRLWVDAVAIVRPPDFTCYPGRKLQTSVLNPFQGDVPEVDASGT